MPHVTKSHRLSPKALSFPDVAFLLFITIFSNILTNMKNVKPWIILSTGSCHKYGLYRFFEVAKKAGFKEIELVIDDQFDNREPTYIKKLEKKFGLKVISVHSAMEFVTSWKDSQTRLKNSIKLAKDIKAKYLIVHTWDNREKDFLSWAIENQKKIATSAKPVQIVFENATCRFDTETRVQKNPSYHFDIMKQFNSINLDTSHIGTAEMDLLEYYEQIKDRINHIHFSDSDSRIDPNNPEKIQDCHFTPGRGKLPLKKFLKQLKADKYSGPISIELWSESFGKNVTEELVIKNLKLAKKFVETNFK